MDTEKISQAVLKQLEPIGGLSEARLAELEGLCFLETVQAGSNPFHIAGFARQLVYLIRGELSLIQTGDVKTVLSGGTDAAKHPLGRRAGIESAKAISDIEILRIDDELLDLMATWDQLINERTAENGGLEGALAQANWGIMSGVFSINNLKFGAFARLPAAHIENLLKRFSRITVKKGQVIVREGEEGDYYYVIESGKCRVERMIGGVSMLLAEIKSGDAFGEEALVSEAKRNATVTAISDGILLHLEKRDFLELLREPLLQKVTMDEARQRVLTGAQWLDVRFPSEYQYDKLPGAMNIPLSEIRNAFGVLDRDREYLVYCQSERRSSAAAFLLAQRGYRASVLDGGLWGRR